MLPTLDIDEARAGLKEAMLTQGPDFIYNPRSLYTCKYEPINAEEARHHAEDIVDLEDYPDSEAYEARVAEIFANDPRVKTACLVGTHLTLRGNTEHLDTTTTVLGLFERFPGMMTEEAMSYLEAAQQSQDRGDEWGHSVEEAEAYWMAKGLPTQGGNY